MEYDIHETDYVDLCINIGRVYKGYQVHRIRTAKISKTEVQWWLEKDEDMYVDCQIVHRTPIAGSVTINITISL
jgi:hypothetical protein